MRKSVPEGDRHRRDCDSSPSSRHFAKAKNACCGDDHIQSESNRKRQQRQIDNDGDQPVERFTDLAAFDDAVIRSRRNQQRNNTDHREESDPIQIAQMAWKLVVGIVENSAKLEAEEDLRTEDQYARLVKRNLIFFVSSIRSAAESDPRSQHFFGYCVPRDFRLAIIKCT